MLFIIREEGRRRRLQKLSRAFWTVILRRPRVLGWLRSDRDAGLKKFTIIRKIKKHPSMYDVVVIGTSVWNDTMSTSIRTYISQYREHFKKVAFFRTQDGSENAAIKGMEILCGKKPAASLKLRRKQEVEKASTIIRKISMYHNCSFPFTCRNSRFNLFIREGLVNTESKKQTISLLRQSNP